MILLKRKKHFFQFGMPEIIQSDNRKEFYISMFTKMCDDYNIIHIKSRPRHPQSNGKFETLNQTITCYMQKFLYEVESKVWIVLLEKITYNYNTSVHSAIKKTPFTIFFKRNGFNSIRVKENNFENE
jgi:transposase InsO family protein